MYVVMVTCGSRRFVLSGCNWCRVGYCSMRVLGGVNGFQFTSDVGWSSNVFHRTITQGRLYSSPTWFGFFIRDLGLPSVMLGAIRYRLPFAPCSFALPRAGLRWVILGGSAMSSSIGATLRAFTALRSVQFTIGLRFCPFLCRPVAWGWLCASPPCFLFSGDFSLASVLLGGLSYTVRLAPTSVRFPRAGCRWVVLGLP